VCFTGKITSILVRTCAAITEKQLLPGSPNYLLSTMNYLFIINPKSGDRKNRKAIVKDISQCFNKSSTNFKIVYTAAAGDGVRIAKNAIEGKYDVVIAAGGDGTVNDVANGLVNSQIPLGILPLGSGNGLARSLKIPLKASAAIKVLQRPKIITMDVGVADERLFFGVCGLGFDAMIGHKFQEFGPRGQIPYFIIGLKEYVKYRDQKYIIRTDTKTITVKSLLVTVANTSQYGAGAIIAPSADFQDGLLDVCILEKVQYFKALSQLPALFTGKIDQLKQYSHFRCRSAEITPEIEKGYLHLDGEPKPYQKTITIGIKPAALRVCVPGQESEVRSQKSE
jgi:YegS/Rv2252/BmrU family lipid kinase